MRKSLDKIINNFNFYSPKFSEIFSVYTLLLFSLSKLFNTKVYVNLVNKYNSKQIIIYT